MLKATPHNQLTPHKNENDALRHQMSDNRSDGQYRTALAMEPWLMRGDWGASAGVGTGAPLSG